MAEKQNHKERLKEITDSIETGIMELFESDKYKSYLQTMSRFHKYSLNNTLLIIYIATKQRVTMDKVDKLYAYFANTLTIVESSDINYKIIRNIVNITLSIKLQFKSLEKK